jgi:predicted porin
MEDARMRVVLGTSLAVLAVAGAAHAQGTVTLYGIVDDGFNWTAVAAIKNLTPPTSDRQSTVRVGIRHKF